MAKKNESLIKERAETARIGFSIDWWAVIIAFIVAIILVKLLGVSIPW